MIKNLSTTTKGYLVTIFFVIFLSLALISFFLYRTKKIDNYCFEQATQELKNQEWPDPSSLTQDQYNSMQQAQLLLTIETHQDCVENQKLFYLF